MGLLPVDKMDILRIQGGTKSDMLGSSESGGWMIDTPQRIGREGYNGIK